MTGEPPNISDGARPEYRCESPVLLMIFNRLDVSLLTLDAIRAVRPRRLYIAADGPRADVPEDRSTVPRVRAGVLEAVDWECDVHTLFRPTNLGCKEAVSGAVRWFLDHEGEGIVLEDDCVGTPGFFAFCDWGLATFRNEHRVGSISGSNLVEDLVPIQMRNGFSALISPWGWATWARAWAHYSGVIDEAELKRVKSRLASSGRYSWWQVGYWLTQFRHAMESSSIWDMHLQYAFFRENLVSVFPGRNLVLNLGFGDEGTHTTGRMPDFVRRTAPTSRSMDVVDRREDLSLVVNTKRDDVLSATIWRCTPMGTLRFMMGSLYRRIVRG